MKSYYCENCAFFDELKNEQPCCCCVDGINFVELEGEEQIMSKKQIEEMARAMCPFSKNTLCRECSDECFYKDYAERAYNAGYRKTSEVAREIFEEIDDLDIQLNNGDLDIKYFGSAIAELKKKYTA